MRFGRWTVIESSRKIEGKYKTKCKCDCGVVREVVTATLRNGSSKSCGCANLERHTRHGHAKRGVRSKTYQSWHAMIMRCTNERNPEYHRYKKVKICARWMEFSNFLEDMGERPENTTLDRIDNSKGYSLDNCKWSTPKEQGNNRKNNRNILFNGETKTLRQWSECLNMKYSTLHGRICKQNMTASDAFTLPLKRILK